ncbi:MAG: glucosyl-3-phosphoglycerate synthase [Aeromicrobium erythreum]
MPESTDPLQRAQDWVARRTAPRGPVDVDALVAAKAGRRVSAILPARDESATVGLIVKQLVTGPLADGLLDEVLVVDSHSTDDTAEVAASAGATVVACDGDPADGKGAALLTGVRHLRGDLGIFLDADVTDFDPLVAARLVGPLLLDPDLVFVKGFYDRPWSAGGGPSTGGRVTELVARPLLLERVPELAGFAQPLAGEAAFRRDALAAVDVVSGYGVDVGHLLALHAAHGLDALAQADLGERRHRHQDLPALGRMSRQVAAAFDLVLDGRDTITSEHAVPVRRADGLALERTTVVTRRLGRPGSAQA